MTVTVATFRQTFPEFAEGPAYPNAMVGTYITLAGHMLNNPARWGAELQDYGRMLFVAHHCVLERRALDAVAAGGPPGMSRGIINSESVDKVSVGYDTQGGSEEGAGHWNLTEYGIRLKSMMNMMGAGAVQLGGVPRGVGPLNSANAWAGPPQYNFPNDS